MRKLIVPSLLIAILLYGSGVFFLVTKARAVASATPTPSPVPGVVPLGKHLDVCVVDSAGNIIPAAGAGTVQGACNTIIRIMGADGSIVDDLSTVHP